MGVGRPLMMAVCEVYSGPWVPLIGLRGKVTITGMKPGDEVAIASPHGELLRVSDNGNFALPSIPERIRAHRLVSTGAEVFVWVI